LHAIKINTFLIISKTAELSIAVLLPPKSLCAPKAVIVSIPQGTKTLKTCPEACWSTYEGTKTWQNVPRRMPDGAHKRKEATFRMPLRAENETRIMFCKSMVINVLHHFKMKLGVK
jgi:hypothetical protein